MLVWNCRKNNQNFFLPRRMDDKENKLEYKLIFYNSLLLENIFHFLNAYDLSSCSRVCSLWYKIAAIEKKRRTDIAWIFTLGPCLQSMEPCDSTEGAKVGKNTFGQLENLSIQPVFCTAFMSSNFYVKTKEFFPSFANTKCTVKRYRRCDSFSRRSHTNSVMNMFKSFLPKRCNMTLTIATGIIGCKTDCIPLEVEYGTAVTAFFIPEVPGVKVDHYAISEKESDLTEFVSKNAPVKCLLFFFTYRGSHIASKLFRSCFPEKEGIKIAVGGAVVDQTSSLLGSAVAFCGPNVEAASIIINPNDHAEEIVAKLEVFRESGLLKNKCFAYMFASVRNGEAFHLKCNVESEIFNKMYPKVPIMGVFGEGEIGVNYIPNFVLEGKKLKVGEFKSSKGFQHFLTIIFVLISIKM